MLGDKLTDYTGGFNMYSMDLINAINFEKMHSAGYGFLIDLKITMLKNTKLLIQIPIAFSDRSRGESKMPLNTIIDNFILVIKLKFFK
jgi:dolichol-phosphate mannosyltransferase